MDQQQPQQIDERPQPWLFTFGIGHQHAGRYVVITGTYDSARAAMMTAHGNAWAFQYSSAAAAGVDRFGLEQLPTPVQPLDQADVYNPGHGIPAPGPIWTNGTADTGEEELREQYAQEDRNPTEAGFAGWWAARQQRDRVAHITAAMQPDHPVWCTADHGTAPSGLTYHVLELYTTAVQDEQLIDDVPLIVSVQRVDDPATGPGETHTILAIGHQLYQPTAVALDSDTRTRLIAALLTARALEALR